jgi:membrane protease YdiL (CAAX protease family)
MDSNPEFETQELVSHAGELGPTPAPQPPGENPPWSGWDVFRLALIMFAVPYLLIPIAVFAAQKTIYHGLSFMDVAHKPWILLATQFGWYVVVAFYMVMFVEGTYRVRFWDAIRWNWPRKTWPTLVPLGMVLVLLQVVEKFFHLPKHIPMEDFLSTPSAAILTAIFAVSLGPFMEELFFRGFLYPVLVRKTGVIWAIAITSLAFGVVHAAQLAFAPGLVLVILLVGTVLTIVRAKTGSVGSSLVVHLAYNATLVIMGVIATKYGLK